MLGDRVEVETPELVVVSYDLAGVGSRINAALIDVLLCVLVIIGVVMLWVMAMPPAARLGSSPDRLGGWAIAVLIFAQFAVLWGYSVLFEALADGRTIGKRIMRLRVVRDGGLSVTFGASAVRNLMRIIDMQPGFTYAVGIITMILNKQGKRLGDIAGGTLVVREELLPPLAAATPAPAAAAGGAPRAVVLQAELSEPEFALLARFVERRGDLDPARRAQFVAQLSERFATHLRPWAGQSPAAQLVKLHASEAEARRQGAAVRRDTGAARERHAIVAANAERWAAFAGRLAVAQKGGLRSLGEQGVREFVQEYRELTADLARLRTASRGEEGREVFYVNRLVSGAHNLLYRRRTISPAEVVRFLFFTVPQEIRRSSRPILLAAALLFVPLGVTAVAVSRDAEAATAFLPPAMFDRAEDGVRAAREGEGYVDVPEIYRPTMASSIIANNLQVAFLAFASGITAGVMTVWVLVSNGLSIGAVLGLYVSKGIGSLILAFIAPHGVLELFAICLAGAAGLLIGAAIFVPGDRTRRRALVENGRRAASLVAGATFLLLFAGLIEGFISPIPWWPLELKLTVSAVTALALYAYLRQGAVRARPAPSVPDSD
jgi:uncharacterized membrane protein SpoIIM required for sporulation/uncharacterized RDD family membrane protein YckC